MIVVPADLIEGYARTGRTGDAGRLLDWQRDAADHRDIPWARITGSRAAAVLHLANGDPKAAAAAVEPAVAQARERQLPLELGRCLLVLGTAQRRTRRRRTAAQTLDEAVQVFDDLGAQRWAELARAERARLAHTTNELLTPAEQRIAELVALGRTNAEIAATLLVTVKTVEGTLTRIYRKLGVRSRVDLARRATT
jgi:DNA-binding CsgD family transcriptional regulator